MPTALGRANAQNHCACGLKFALLGYAFEALGAQPVYFDDLLSRIPLPTMPC
jgi:hypothetical protein